MKPRGLRESIILQATSLVLCAPFFFEPIRKTTGVENLVAWFLVLAAIYGGSCLALVAYWRGWNWARICVILVSLIALLPFDVAKRWTTTSVPARMLIVANMILSVWLLYFLTRPAVRSWFRQRQVRVPQWLANCVAVAIFLLFLLGDIRGQ